MSYLIPATSNCSAWQALEIAFKKVASTIQKWHEEQGKGGSVRRLSYWKSVCVWEGGGISEINNSSSNLTVKMKRVGGQGNSAPKKKGGGGAHSNLRRGEKTVFLSLNLPTTAITHSHCCWFFNSASTISSPLCTVQSSSNQSTSLTFWSCHERRKMVDENQSSSSAVGVGSQHFCRHVFKYTLMHFRCKTSFLFSNKNVFFFQWNTTKCHLHTVCPNSRLVHDA